MKVESYLNLAVSTLIREGLVAKLMKEPCPWIQGGTHTIDSSIGPVIKNSFGIECKKLKWIARVPGEGQLQNEVEFSDVDEAVAFVIQYFKK